MQINPILKSVSTHTLIPVSAITEKGVLKPRPDVSRARAMAALLFHDLTGWALQRIADQLGMTRPGVWKALWRARALCTQDKSFKIMFEKCKKEAG